HQEVCQQMLQSLGYTADIMPNQFKALEYLERVAEFHWGRLGLHSFLLPLAPSSLLASFRLLLLIPYWVSATKSRMNLFRLNERIDRGPAISSVCHRRSWGLLNLYRLLFNVPMLPSVRPRSLRICSRTPSATDHGRFPLG